MKLVVGLGNPGPEYSKTRHNIGFLAVDKIVEKFNIKKSSTRFSSTYYELNAKNKLIVVMPQTYMNRSGIAIQGFCNFFKIPSKDVMVIHDDLDLDLGRIKVKIGGGSGGHNGLKSVDQHIGQNYLRIRLGIGKPDKQVDVADYVLKKFYDEEKLIVDIMTSFVAENIEDLLVDDLSLNTLSRFLAKYNKKP